MKEQSILFKPWLALKVHNGDKTQTRRGHDIGVEVGDRLWVKEEHYRYGHWETNGTTKTGKIKWIFVGHDDRVKYADNPPENVLTGMTRAIGWYKRNSLFMPRWASRTTCEVTSVHRELLQDISEVDAIAEGVEYLPNEKGWKYYGDNGLVCLCAIDSFFTLWDSINGDKDGKAVKDNPWVWVYKFKRVK